MADSWFRLWIQWGTSQRIEWFSWSWWWQSLSWRLLGQRLLCTSWSKPYIYRVLGRTWPSCWLARSSCWWFQQLRVVRGRLSRLRWWGSMMITWSGFWDMGPSWSGTQWRRRSRLRRISKRQSRRRWLEKWVCSSWCRLVSRYRDFFCRYHRWLRCRGWLRHQCAPRGSESREWSCMAQQLQWRFGVMDKLWIRAWIFFHNRLRVFRVREIPILILFLLRLSGT